MKILQSAKTFIKKLPSVLTKRHSLKLNRPAVLTRLYAKVRMRSLVTGSLATASMLVLLLVPSITWSEDFHKIAPVELPSRAVPEQLSSPVENDIYVVPENLIVFSTAPAIPSKITFYGVHSGARSEKKTWMDYRTITSRSSKQWALQQICYTGAHGLRYFGGRPTVALGLYYTGGVGEIVLIQLDTGEEFEAIVGDVKSNAHTNDSHQYTVHDGSVVEFIVDRDALDSRAIVTGNIGSTIYPGKIVSIAKVEF
ncbi:MAG: hypothetical protein LBN36_07010 [Clostridiales Family XIII bacterium]|jgi:hypothetical protein|nr:hypothetical protein [Clostridiales Family XIII bacterium]